jgi:hypothetical protein
LENYIEKLSGLNPFFFPVKDPKNEFVKFLTLFFLHNFIKRDLGCEAYKLLFFQEYVSCLNLMTQSQISCPIQAPYLLHREKREMDTFGNIHLEHPQFEGVQFQ